MATNPGETDGNNPVSRSSQNKPQLLEATMRNVPKLKELNYAQWKNIITNSIKRAKLWEYIDGSIEEPAEHDARNLTTYYDEAAAVRNAILGSLEPSAQKYIEEALDPRDAWLALEKKYLTAEADTDSKLVSIEQQLVNLRLDEGGDVIEHIAEFCRMRCQLNGTRLAIDDQTCISMLYRSLPPSYRQSVLTPEGAEMMDFSALCARLTYVSQNPTPETPADDTPPAPVEDYTTWGVPEDIKAFGLTGGKNPLLEERAAVTCRDCLLKDHQAGTPECPQYEWRKELWGTERENTPERASESAKDLPFERPIPANSRRLSYEFSDPVKVVLGFDELELKPNLRNALRIYPKPSAIQQCAILPIINGRNALIQAPPCNGKTTAFVISILQLVDTTVSHAQALVITPTVEASTAFQKVVNSVQKSYLSARCSSEGTTVALLAGSGIKNQHIFVGTPSYLLQLISRNIISIHKLRIVVLDDVDKLMDMGKVDETLELYRHVPPLAQVVASSTVFSSSISSTVAKLLADPLQISVRHNEGITAGTHFYVIVPAVQKENALYASFSVLGVDGIALTCHDFSQINHLGNTYGLHYLWESMQPIEWENTMQNFTSRMRSIPYYKSQNCNRNLALNVILATTDAALSTTRLKNVTVPLLNYDVPSNVEDYIKRLVQWRIADPDQSQVILTVRIPCVSGNLAHLIDITDCSTPYGQFVTADTDEIHVIQDLERYHGVRVVEMLWDEESKTIH